MSSQKGFFLTLEGGEGAGKTTQIELLAKFLRDNGHDVVTTREPGGTPESEKIRDLLAKRDGGNWTPIAEVLLFFAARVMHVENLIKPALSEGKIVICDRFTDSTRAYQSFGHTLPREIIEAVNTTSLGDFGPDLTLILDLPAQTGLSRSKKRLDNENSDEDRFEQLEIDFHEKLRQGFLQIAKEDPDRCVVIDATKDVQSIASEIKEIVGKRLDV